MIFCKCKLAVHRHYGRSVVRMYGYVFLVLLACFVQLIGSSGVRFPNPTRGNKNGQAYVEGLIEVYNGGYWRPTCAFHFNDNAARVMCRMAGYANGFYNGGAYNKRLSLGTGAFLCKGSESDIDDCSQALIGICVGFGLTGIGIRCYVNINTCSNVKCYQHSNCHMVNGFPICRCNHGYIGSGTTCRRITSVVVRGSIRFPNPTSVNEVDLSYTQGHVEILHNGIWGTICDHMFNNDGANVVCRMGGYLYGTYDVKYKQVSASKSLMIWLDNVKCNGRERNIGECWHRSWGVHNCGHHEDVGVRCYEKDVCFTGEGFYRNGTACAEVCPRSVLDRCDRSREKCVKLVGRWTCVCSDGSTENVCRRYPTNIRFIAGVVPVVFVFLICLCFFAARRRRLSGVRNRRPHLTPSVAYTRRTIAVIHEEDDEHTPVPSNVTYPPQTECPVDLTNISDGPPSYLSLYPPGTISGLEIDNPVYDCPPPPYE